MNRAGLSVVTVHQASTHNAYMAVEIICSSIEELCVANHHNDLGTQGRERQGKSIYARR